MTPATTSASLIGESSTAKGSAPGLRTARRCFSSHNTVCAGFSGMSEISAYIESGARPARFSADTHPSSTLRETTATGVPPPLRRRPMAKLN